MLFNKAAVTAEHLKCGSSKSRCAVSAKRTLSFKDLVPKRIKYLDFLTLIYILILVVLG